MARIPMYDPLTSEARSPLIAGLTEACSKLSSILDLKVEQAYDLPLNPVYVTPDDKYRIYQAALGNKLWLETPAPVIKQNGIVITPSDDEFTIDYFGGSIAFDNNKQLTEFDIITADVTYIVPDSEVIENIITQIETLALSADRFKGYYNSLEALNVSVPVGSIGDYAIVGGNYNTIYIWDFETKSWVSTFKETDLSNYYNIPEVDDLLDKKEAVLLPHGETPTDDNYYYGGRKTWVNFNDKVKGSTLDGIDTSNAEKVTDDDNVLSAVGKLQGQIDNFVHDLFGEGNPTKSTEGKIGQDYTNTSTGEKFHLISIESNGEYIWTPYQEQLEIDDTPTVGSENPVTSNGIYQSLQEKADKVIPTKSGNIVTLDADGNLVDSGKGVDDVGKLPVIAEVNLFSSMWEGTSAPYSQTVSVEGAISNETKQIVWVSSDPISSNINVIMSCSIYCTGQGNGTLTFTAFDGLPTENVTFNVVLQNI